jgi:hypothetical protein
MLSDTILELNLRVLDVQEPWRAFVIPVSAFPVPNDECDRLKKFLTGFSVAACSAWKLSSEVFMELEQMKGLPCRHLFADRARDWMPEVGLGVWPDREPPAIWTREEFEDLPPGGKLRELMCEVFRISTSQEQRARARAQMLEFGCLVEILTIDSTERFLSSLKEPYLKFIKARSHRCFPYYIPLLEGATLEKFGADELSRWCPGVSVYVRQSFQDRGILIASPLAIEDIIREMGGTFSAESQTYKVLI